MRQTPRHGFPLKVDEDREWTRRVEAMDSQAKIAARERRRLKEEFAAQYDSAVRDVLTDFARRYHVTGAIVNEQWFDENEPYASLGWALKGPLKASIHLIRVSVMFGYTHYYDDGGYATLNVLSVTTYHGHNTPIRIDGHTDEVLIAEALSKVVDCPVVVPDRHRLRTDEIFGLPAPPKPKPWWASVPPFSWFMKAPQGRGDSI